MHEKNDKMKILFVLQVIGHPRDSKRIKMLQQEGFEIEAVAFEREYHKGRQPGCRVTTLGRINHGQYLNRGLKILRALPIIRRAISRNDIIYASGQDVAFSAYIAGLGLSRPVVMEVGDIVHLQLSGDLRGKVVRRLDRFITARYGLLVVISQGFLDTYYRQWLKIGIPALVIENKLEPDIFDALRPDTKEKHTYIKPLIDRPLRVGYFGLLRDNWSWLVLKHLAVSHPEKFEIVFAGYPVDPKDIGELVKNYPGMSYLGEYRSPDDLASLYDRVDMVWACYPEINTNDWNLRWGRPNRFFESCFFGKPCFARKGSLFADDVEKLNLGCVISEVEIELVIDQIASISYQDFNIWKANLAILPHDFYIYSHEAASLGKSIRQLIKSSRSYYEEDRIS